jgi:hypothetical protein
VIAQLTAELTHMRAEASDRELKWQQLALTHSLKWQSQLLESQRRVEAAESEKERILLDKDQIISEKERLISEMQENDQVRVSQLQASRASAMQARKALDAAIKAASVREAALEMAKKRLVSEHQTVVTALREDAAAAKKISEAEIATLHGLNVAKDKSIESLKQELLPLKRKSFAEDEIKAQLREAQLVAAQLVERQEQLKSEKEAAEATAGAALLSSKQESHNVAARLSASIPFHVSAITKDLQKEADRLHEELEVVRKTLRVVTQERDDAVTSLSAKEAAANKAVKIAATLQRLADSVNVHGKSTSPRKTTRSDSSSSADTDVKTKISFDENTINNNKNENNEDDNTSGSASSSRGRPRSVATSNSTSATVVDPFNNATVFAAGALSPMSIKKRILSRSSKEALMQSGLTLSHNFNRANSSSSSTSHIDSLGGPSPALPPSSIQLLNSSSNYFSLGTQMLMSPPASASSVSQKRATPMQSNNRSSVGGGGASYSASSSKKATSPRSSSSATRLKSASPPLTGHDRRLRSASPPPSSSSHHHSLNYPTDPRFLVALKGRRGRMALRLGVSSISTYLSLQREKLRNAFNALRINKLSIDSETLSTIMTELVANFGEEVVKSSPPAAIIKTRFIALAQTAHDLSIAAQNALAEASILNQKAESLTQTTKELTVKLQMERESLAASNEDARKLHKALGETEAMRLALEMEMAPLKSQVGKLQVAEAERNKALEKLKSIESGTDSLRSDINNLRAANSRLVIQREFIASISELLEACSKDPNNANTSTLTSLKTDALTSDLILLRENALSTAALIKSRTSAVKSLESALHATSEALSASQRQKESSELFAQRARSSLDSAESEVKTLKDKLVSVLKNREEVEEGREGLMKQSHDLREKQQTLAEELKKEKERAAKLQAELDHSVKRATDLATTKASIESENVRLKSTLAQHLAALNYTSSLSSSSTTVNDINTSATTAATNGTARRSAPPPPPPTS